MFNVHVESMAQGIDLGKDGRLVGFVGKERVQTVHVLFLNACPGMVMV